MASISEQKLNLRELLHKHVTEYLAQNPDQAAEVALGMFQRLTGKMTLRELRDWYTKVSLKNLAREQELLDGERKDEP